MSEERKEAIAKASKILDEAGIDNYLIGGMEDGSDEVAIAGKGVGNNIEAILRAFGHQFPEIFTSLILNEVEKFNESEGLESLSPSNNTIQ